VGRRRCFLRPAACVPSRAACTFVTVGLLRHRNGGLLGPHTNLQGRAACADGEVLVPKPPHKVEGLSRRLLARKPKGVLGHRRFDRRSHLRRRAEEPVGGRKPLQGLVRTLEVVVLNKERCAPLAVVEVGEHRPRQELLPHRLPEPLDLAAGLRVVRPALDMLDALAPQLLLKARRAAPSRVLAPLVGQDLPRRPIVGDRPRERLQHQGAPLVVRHHQAHQVPRVIIQERHHVHPLVAPKQEGEQIRLPKLIRLGALEAPLLRLGPRPDQLARLRKAFALQHPAHRGLGCPDPEEASHHVPDAPAPRLGLGALCFQHCLAPRVGLRHLRPLGLAGRPPLQGVPPASPILPRPLRHRGVRNLELLRHPGHRQLLVDHHRRGRPHHVLGPCPSRRM